MNRMRHRILFVDDSHYVLEALERALVDRKNDWDIECADSGERALELVGQAPFAVVATDLKMPGMDGDALIDRIRPVHPETRYVVLCGDPEAPQAAAMARQGYPVLEKPCDGFQLQAVLDAELAQYERTIREREPRNERQ